MHGSTLAVYVWQQLQPAPDQQNVVNYSSLQNSCLGLVLHQLGAEALLYVVQVISGSWLAQLVNHAVLVAAW